MAKLIHELWRADGDCTAITCCLAGPMGDQARAMLEPRAYLLQVFWAESQFEAGTVRNKILGFEPYRSEWEKIDSQPYSEDWAVIQASAVSTRNTSSTKSSVGGDQLLVRRLAAALMRAAVKNDAADAHTLMAELFAERPTDAEALVHRASRRSKKCTIVLSRLLLERGDAGCAVSDKAIKAILTNTKHVARDTVLMSMQFSNRSRFAEPLRSIVEDRHDPGWDFAVCALGNWRDHGAIDVLMSHAAGVETPFEILAALAKLRPPAAAIVFELSLRHPEPRERTFALWGLAALGYQEAFGALIQLLDDPDLSTESSFVAGQSMRAAQALADVYGIAFMWASRADVEKIRHYCRSLYSSDQVALLAANLAAVHLTHDKSIGGRGKV